jgi:hypothetical protein
LVPSVSVPAPEGRPWSNAHCAVVLSNGFVMPCDVGETIVPLASGTSTDTRACIARLMKSSVCRITSEVVWNCARSRANS